MHRCPNCDLELTQTVEACPRCGYLMSAPAPAASPGTGAVTPALGNWLKAGWELFKQYPGGFIGFLIIYVIIQVFLNYIPYFGWIAAAAFGPPLVMGNFLVSAKLLHRQTPQFGDFFGGFNFFFPLVLVGVVSSVAIMVGLVLLIIPGVYLAVGYLFAASLVVDRRLDFWQAMELSRKTVHPQWFSFFALVLMLVVINLVGALALGLGLLVTVPLTFTTITAAFGEVFGWQSDYSGPVPQLRQS